MHENEEYQDIKITFLTLWRVVSTKTYTYLNKPAAEAETF